MRKQHDDEILYHYYVKLGEKNEAKKSKSTIEKDKEIISSIVGNVSLMLLRLENTERSTMAEIHDSIMLSKALYTQYSLIKGRSPKLIGSSLNLSMDRLLLAMSRNEAENISWLRSQEKDGDKIDIDKIFTIEQNMLRLGFEPARSIVAEEFRRAPKEFLREEIYYITRSGKRFHLAECPYCKGRNLIEISESETVKENITPCGCVFEYWDAPSLEINCVTAFIDESIHTVMWNEDGRKGKAGSYSYIICRGSLNDESQITEKNLIAQGVDFMGEYTHVERLTEAAVGKVLLTLSYDYGFGGGVKIYTDNSGAVSRWDKVYKNSQLSKRFTSVKVKYIPREKNKLADKLGRSRILLDMPVGAYNEWLKKSKKIDELNIKVKQLEKELANIREIPEVIVAANVISAEEEENKSIVIARLKLCFDKIRKTWRDDSKRNKMTRLGEMTNIV